MYSLLSLDINFTFKLNENMKENTQTHIKHQQWKYFWVNIFFYLFHGVCILPTPVNNGGTQWKSAMKPDRPSGMEAKQNGGIYDRKSQWRLSREVSRGKYIEN